MKQTWCGAVIRASQVTWRFHKIKKVLFRTEKSKKLILFLDIYNTGTHFA